MSRSFETGGAPHFPPHSTVAGVMLQLVYALIPAIAAHVWFFGPGILAQIVLAAGFAVGFEAMMLKMPKSIALALTVMPQVPYRAAGVQPPQPLYRARSRE